MTDWPINQPGDFTQLAVPTDILCSYHYFSDIDMGRIASWGTRIIGDSGAFSAMSSGKPIEREDFHAWADRWRDDLFWVAALDVIGDAEASYQNWQAARRDGLELVPTIHYGEGTDQLDRFAEEGATLIGLGGMVPYSSEKDRLMRWCLMMHRHARDHHPQVRFHGWGISHPYLVDNLPWWSTDSSGFSSCFRFGTLRLWHPRRGRFYGVDLNGRDLAKHAKLLREVYGVDWKLIATSTPENRRPLGRVAIRSVQLYVKWLQSRQQVTAPELLQDRLHRFDAEGSVTGPLNAVATVRNESWNALNPTGGQSLENALAGPLGVAAMGAPEMQPVKALSPEGSAPDRAGGPLQVAAMGGPFSAQGQAITPNGLAITQEAQRGPFR